MKPLSVAAYRAVTLRQPPVPASPSSAAEILIGQSISGAAVAVSAVEWNALAAFAAVPAPATLLPVLLAGGLLGGGRGSPCGRRSFARRSREDGVIKDFVANETSIRALTADNWGK